MGWCTTHNQDEFTAAAGSYLASRPVENTLLLAALDERSARADALFGWLDRDGGIRGAFIHRPPKPVLTGGMAPEAAAALADTLARMSVPVRGIDAAAPAADAFATAWRRRTGEPGQVRSHSRVYQLTDANADQRGEPGQARPATRADREVVADWLTSFGTEVGDLSGAAGSSADDLLSRGGVMLWEMPGGVPVAMAVVTPPLAGVVRITSLYTPRELRHRGYASAVLAAACRTVRAKGASEVLLITDASSALNGNLRRRLGCEPAGDRLTLYFTAPTGPMAALSLRRQPAAPE
jgi:ribosomal protein S18 acetylase RimI-like enzyme